MSDVPNDLMILQPRIARVRRADLRYLSIGDEAVAVLAPGLLQFLVARDPHGTRLDEGLCSEWETPVGVAGSAVYAVLKPPGAVGSAWTGARNTVIWIRPARPGEVLVAEARIASFGRTSATVAFRVTSEQTGEEIVTGELVMVYMSGQGPEPIDFMLPPATGPSAPMASLTNHGTASAGPSPADQSTGRVLYVLINDFGGFEAGDVEDYRLRVIATSNALNEIANRYGARWTHLWPAAPRVPGTSARQDVAELDRSIYQGARRHEYAPGVPSGPEPAPALRSRLRFLSRLSFGGTYTLANRLWAYAAQANPGDADRVYLQTPVVRYDRDSLETINDWFDRCVAACRGPATHLIVGCARVVSMRGEPDRSRRFAGGDFDKLARHLRYVRTTYPAVEFVTASEAVLSYLDERTFSLRAVAMQPAEISAGGTLLRIPIRLVGGGISISPDEPATVSAQVPHYLDPEAIRRITVLEKGADIGSAVQPYADFEAPAVTFGVRYRLGYELEVEMTPVWYEGLRDELSRIAPGWRPNVAQQAATGYDTIFQLRRPYPLMQDVENPEHPTAGDTWVLKFPGDVFRLVIHPAGGGSQPIGREFHPYGRISEGAMVYAVGRALGSRYAPARLELNYVNPIRGDGDFVLRCRVVSADDRAVVTDHAFFEGHVQVAQAVLTCVRRDLQPASAAGS